MLQKTAISELMTCVLYGFGEPTNATDVENLKTDGNRNIPIICKPIIKNYLTSALPSQNTVTYEREENLLFTTDQCALKESHDFQLTKSALSFPEEEIFVFYQMPVARVGKQNNQSIPTHTHTPTYITCLHPWPLYQFMLCVLLLQLYKNKTILCYCHGFEFCKPIHESSCFTRTF